MNISGSNIEGDIILRDAIIEGDILLVTGPVWGPESTLDLRAASVRGIDDTKDAWPPTLQLTGFEYRSAAVSSSADEDGFIDRSTDWYLSWLDRQPAFSRQPYQQLETMLRDVERGATADDIAIARRNRELGLLWRSHDLPRWTIAQLHRVTVFYGFRPELSLVWMLLLWGLGALVARRIPSTYRLKNGVTSPGLFSFDRLVPLVTLHKADRNLDLTDDAVPAWIGPYFYFQTIAGWVLAAFFVTAIGRIAV